MASGRVLRFVIPVWHMPKIIARMTFACMSAKMVMLNRMASASEPGMIARSPTDMAA